MKRTFIYLASAALCTLATTATAQKRAVADDSMRMYHLQQIEVTATRASQATPVAYSDLSSEQLARNSYANDIPSILALTPSMVATNETGIGIGSTSMRLRGTDASRLNVTINGVAMNNPDSHSMYWYDTPDLISAVGSMQVQRGAGISTNGTGAFGGAITMATAPLSTKFGGEASLSYGSYNTNKQAVAICSGLMGGHWAVDARLTHIGSDGYIDRGATDLKSYMFQAGYYKGNTMIKFLSFGGVARTYLTYNGATLEEMRRNGRRYNSSGMYTTTDALSHRVWDSEAGEYQQVNYYKDQTDNYLQINNQLHLNHRFNDRWSINAAGFYTYGKGFYKQYRDDAKLIEYGFAPEKGYMTDKDGGFVLDDKGKKIKIRKDMIREKLMRNHFGGVNATAHYTSEQLEMSFGTSWSYYTSPHWGELSWVADTQFDRSERWYDNDVNKQDANLFARASWSVAKGLKLFADLQYRFVSYKAWGVNDNYDGEIGAMQPIDVDQKYHFFNPRAGLSYTFAKRHHLFASFAIAQKEPTRNDFTDRYRFAERDSYPTAERLYDYELGYQYTAPRFTAGVNLYYMHYKDQLVHTGLVNDSSDALNINVPESYRRGVELSASWSAAKWLRVGANATFSQNKIKDYVDMLYDSPTYGKSLGDMQISYAPSTIAGLFLDFHVDGFEVVLHTQYVGKQYFTNNQTEALSLDNYCVTNLNLGYTLRTKTAKTVQFGVAINNLFNALYSSNGFGYSYMWDGERTDMSYYFAQAPLNVLANITVKF